MSGERLLTCLGVSCWLRFLQLVKGLFIGTLVLSITRRRGHLKDKGRDPRVDAGGGKVKVCTWFEKREKGSG